MLILFLFIFQKIDVNALIDGRVPLHYAADYGQTVVLNYLLDKGADPNVRFTVLLVYF